MRAPVGLWLALFSGIILMAQRSAPAGTPAAAGIGLEHLRSVPCKDSATGFTFTPLGLGFGLRGELYVVDSDHCRVFQLSLPEDEFSLFFECPQDLPDCQLLDLDTDQAGGIYVSEKSQGAVLALDRWGELVTQLDVGEDIAGIDVAASGGIYAAMSLAGGISFIDPGQEDQVMESSLAHHGSGSYPVDCLVFGKDRVLVTDAFSRRVWVYSLLGDPRGWLQGFEFKSPFGLAAFSETYVLVSDQQLGQIVAFDARGQCLGSLAQGVLSTPTFLACREDGTICVADAGSMTIEVFRIVEPKSD
jgi:hypothetical protein